ncbi:alpha-xenorhabdolysin family binary toxin subunit A [Pseudomonas sp. PDM28]|uniref:alpha-xenorhabdolysin family binary toxin subunit A n=1 Tax=Pseudomonas sp. PDM28 TaxID=2854770 RepID=UPI001C487357|nr:alpha-xenorhabdolysin family binary toxin subunit A [Pseudomonas sp. PDM28]MBV7555519.1 alpha-xenorhabdolysin family binary toxin subunit A [Pseudomonas sp. PDM28]
MLATEEQVITAEQLNSLTSDFMGAVSGTLEGVEREKGLLVTNDDIRKIKRYVNAGLKLPIEINEIEQIYKFDQVSITGLTSADMQVLFLPMRSHAASWSPLESNMKKVGSDLHVFADNFTSNSQSIIKYLESLPSYISGTGKVGDLSPEEIDNLPEIQLTEGEKKKIPALLELVEELKTVITEHSASTKTTKDQISEFKLQIDALKSKLGLKVTLCNSHNFNEKIKELNDDLKLHNDRIDQKLAEIGEYSKNKWWGVIGGVFGFLVSSTIYGAKANKARNELEQLTTKRREIESEIATTNTVLASLLAFETSLQDLHLRIEDAAGSSSNLESLWQLIQTYVESSSKKLVDVTNAMYLVTFATKLITMMDNWSAIKKQAGDLLTAFNNATSDS